MIVNTTKIQLMDSEWIHEVVTSVESDNNFRLSSDGVNTLTLESGYIPQFSACAEMVRDLAKEAEHNDGFAYWKLTGRTVVTWADGSVTYLIRKDVYTYSVTVVDCGYDESLPF